MERKIQLILGGLSILVILLIAYKLSTSKEDNSITTPINSTENMDDFKRVMNKLIKVIDKDRKSNKLLLDEVKKLNQLNKLQTKYLGGIKPKIFGKDIEKHRVYIDTHNIKSGNLDRSNYVYYFQTLDTSNTNETAGYTEINNVIGFRLVKALIPNTNHVIFSSRNKVRIQLGSNAIFTNDDNTDVNKIFEVTLATGTYNVDQIEQAFTEGTYKWVSDSSTVATAENEISNKYNIRVSFDSITKLFTFRIVGEDNVTNYNFKFLFSQITENSAASILGFDNTDSSTFLTTQTSTFHPNMTIHYVDLIIDEIPYIACKKNAKGKKLIERIGLTNGIGELIEYIQPWDGDNENYFFPITLDRLSIQLYESTHEHFFDDSRDHTLEFEITTIKNPKEFNLI